MDVFFRHVGETNASSLMLDCAALGVLLLGRKLLPKKPVALLVVIGKTGRRMIIPLSEGLRAHIASLPSSDRADAVIHPRALAILETHGNASTLSRKFGELLALTGLRAFATHQSTGKTRSSRRNLNALSFHSLRRTATTLLHEAGIAGAVAQALIGHDSEVRKLHDLGFPSWAEVSFAEVVEIPNEFLYGFRRGRSGRDRPSPCG
jgi:integrase